MRDSAGVFVYFVIEVRWCISSTDDVCRVAVPIRTRVYTCVVAVTMLAMNLWVSVSICQFILGPCAVQSFEVAALVCTLARFSSVAVLICDAGHVPSRWIVPVIVKRIFRHVRPMFI